jgi:hypothetical protein
MRFVTLQVLSCHLGNKGREGSGSQGTFILIPADGISGRRDMPSSSKSSRKQSIASLATISEGIPGIVPMLSRT